MPGLTFFILFLCKTVYSLYMLLLFTSLNYFHNKAANAVNLQ